MDSRLAAFRSRIDTIDRQLVELLARRFAVIAEVADYKIANGVPARIPSRIKAVIARNEAAGRGLGLPRRAAANIWKVIVEESCRAEERAIAASPRAKAKPSAAKRDASTVKTNGGRLTRPRSRPEA